MMWRKIQALQSLISLIQQPLCLLTTNPGTEALFGENAGKQCVAMLIIAIIYHQIEDTLNLLIGNSL